MCSSSNSGSTFGYVDAQGTNAKFNGPSVVAIDSSNNIYVCENGNLLVRKIAVDATVSTIAGIPGQAGYTDGAGSAARFNTMFGITVGLDGFIYVGDTVNSVIRKINPTSFVVSTFAGSGTRGALDGYGTAANFSSPYGLLSDGYGNILVCDAGNNAIRSINATGYVSTIAGNAAVPFGALDGPTGTSLLYSPYAMFTAPNGDIVFSDARNNLIRRMTCAGPGCPKYNPYVYPSVAPSSSVAVVAASASATVRASSSSISMNPSFIAIVFAFFGAFVF